MQKGALLDVQRNSENEVYMSQPQQTQSQMSNFRTIGNTPKHRDTSRSRGTFASGKQQKQISPNDQFDQILQDNFFQK